MYLRQNIRCSIGEFKHQARMKHRTTDRGLQESAFYRAQGEGKCYACRHLLYYRDGRLAKVLDAELAVCSVDQHIVARAERPHDPDL